MKKMQGPYSNVAQNTLTKNGPFLVLFGFIFHFKIKTNSRCNV